MDFLSTPPRDVPKGTAQCLAVVTIGGAAANGGRRGSAGSNEGDEGGLQRVLSGGRRRSVAAGAGAADKGEGTGTWYWPARVGITDDTLVILPESSPPNGLLRTRPHKADTHTHNEKRNSGGGFMNSIRRASAGFIHKPEQTHPPAPADGTIPEGQVEKNTTTNGSGNDDEAHRETGWPAVVEGQHLQAIVVPLHNIAKDSVHHDSKKDYHVSMSIGSAIAGKSGHLRFEFNKDWIGAKGESELLYNKLATAVENASPLFTSVKLSGKSAADGQHDPDWQGKVRGKW